MYDFPIYIITTVVALTIIVVFLRLRVRRKVTTLQSVGLSLAFVFITLMGWWYVTSGEIIEERIFTPIILPSPMEVVKAFPRLHNDQELMRSVVISFQRVTAGFVLAAILAIPLGVYMAAFPPIAAFFRPLSLVSAYVPTIVFVPLTLAWWGTTETQKIGFLFIGCFVMLLPQIFKTIEDIPASYLDVALTKGATQWQLIYRVLVPVAKADIWEHLRSVYGVGWNWIILAEVVNATNGLGYLISLSTKRSMTNNVFALVIVIVIVAFICDYIWKVVGEFLFPYKEAEQA
jgi:NitT/TauT family transport system permease protein